MSIILVRQIVIHTCNAIDTASVRLDTASGTIDRSIRATDTAHAAIDTSLFRLHLFEIIEAARLPR